MNPIPLLFKPSKHLLILGLLLSSSVSLAQALAISENTKATEQTNKTVADNSQPCPRAFFEVPIPEGGKLCQIFATDLPASMVLFVPQPLPDVIEFYQDEQQFQVAQKSEHRFIIKSNDSNATIILSADGAGTQLDVLVMQDPTQ